MHRISLMQGLEERLTLRRGSSTMYPLVFPDRTALLAIDLQRMFLQQGAPLEIPLAREIVPNVNQIAEVLRRTGGRVVWVQNVFDSETARTWRRYFDDINSRALGQRIGDGLSLGDPLQALWPGCDVHSDDIVSEKDRYSAFHSRRSRLDATLRQLGIDTVLIAGTLTNICCETTARDAMQLDYRVIMLSDACATRTDAEHNATLATIMTNFGDVASVADVEARIDAAGLEPKARLA